MMIKNKKSPTVNVAAKTALARLMATENLTVQHAQVKTASFDVQNRVLKLPMWKDMGTQLYDGLIGHEVGHALWTPFQEWKDFVLDNPKLKDYANIVEDARIEKKIKQKYPGMKKVFFEMYNDLNDRDFFGAKGKDMNEYGFIDRINLFFKIGSRAQIEFSDVEQTFIDRIASAETFKEVTELSLELAEYAKNEQSELENDEIEYGYSENDDVNEDQEYQFGDNDSDDSDSNDEESDEESSDSNSSSKSDDDSDEGEPDDGPSDPDAEEFEENGENGESGESNNSRADTVKEFDDAEIPQSSTARNFEDALMGEVDENAKPDLYVNLPKVNTKDIILDYKRVYEELTAHFENPLSYGADYWTKLTPEMGISKKEEIDTEFRLWKKDADQIVNYMVKEFEMKQAATAYRRTSTAKTGVLDTKKLHAYKFDDDLFKRVASVRDGRNHALLMYVDWSGSMCGKMQATIKQLLTLVMFAKKVGIPYRVYGFSNVSRLLAKDFDARPVTGERPTMFYSTEDNKSTNHIPVGRLGLIEFFREKMTSIQFNTQTKNMFKLGLGLDTRYRVTIPDRFSMYSTPLNEAIIASNQMVGDLRSETGREKINVIFLTDGGADGSLSEYWNSENETMSYRDYGRYGSAAQKFMIKDPITGAEFLADSDFTAPLLKNLSDNYGVNVIGFHITAPAPIRRQIDYNYDWREVKAARASFNKNGYIGIKKGGYDTYFLINDRKLDQENEFGEVEKKENGTINKQKLRTAFKKFSKARTVNKMMLNEFVVLVA
jgi:hypothetical protein